MMPSHQTVTTNATHNIYLPDKYAHIIHYTNKIDSGPFSYVAPHQSLPLRNSTITSLKPLTASLALPQIFEQAKHHREC